MDGLTSTSLKAQWFYANIYKERGIAINYIILDLEATCFAQPYSNFKQETCELGAIKINNELKIIDQFQSFVRPILFPVLGDFCLRLTNISQKDVDEADTFPTVLKRFLEWCGSEPYVIVSWGRFDKEQLLLDCEYHDLSTIWFPEHINLKEEFSKVHNTERKYGLKRALKRMKMEMEGTHHRALSDAYNASKIFIKIFDNLK